MAVYACSDFHGMMHFYKTIKEQLKPEDKVFYLGDAGDRGPEPWETIKAVLRDPQFIYIKGNHEDMLCDALADYIDRGCPDYHSLRLLISNGGEETFDQAIRETSLEGWYRKLFRLDTIKEYTNDRGERVILSHAGFTPWKDDFYEDDEEKRDVIFRRPKPHDLIWDRDHIFDEWTAEDCVDCYIVHGHTPIPYLLDEIDPACQMGEIEPGALWYDNGRKCCIDCGAVFTGYCVLLNLDTWEEQVFQAQPYL
jgi:hypothetical protein